MGLMSINGPVFQNYKQIQLHLHTIHISISLSHDIPHIFEACHVHQIIKKMMMLV